MVQFIKYWWAQGYEGIMAQVADMVEREQGRSQAEETAEAAEGLVHANAEALLRRIVAHFQHLFAVDALEGVLPAMNQVTPLSAVLLWSVCCCMDRLTSCLLRVSLSANHW